jgi:pyrroline-5-carboxylate reductase
MITVIGLGVEKGDLTKRGEEILLKGVQEGRPIVVRTAHTVSYQTIAEMQIPHVCLDSVYENSRNFATLSKNLAKAVASKGGTTERALAVLDDNDFEKIIADAMIACTKRADELGK